MNAEPRKESRRHYIDFMKEPCEAQKGGAARKQDFALIDNNASIDSMATLTIRQLDEATKARLRIRAAHHGRSMEEEAREILRASLAGVRSKEKDLAESIRQRFEPLGGVELETPGRSPLRRPPEFGE